MLSQPDPVHWRICAVLEALLTVAEKHNIPVWADYGTLLGLKRDKGVILWDYDADLGMWEHDRVRLMEAVKIEQTKGSITPLLVMDENYYKDVGCMAAYLAKDASHTSFWNDDICDIIFNVQEGDIVKSLQTDKVLEEYPCAYNYSGKVSDVLPLKPDILLGHRVYTWNNWELPLNLTYKGWRVPLKNVSEWIVPAFHGPSVRPLREITATTFAEVLAAKSDTPMIVRNTPLLHSSEERYREALAAQKRPIFGYSSTISWDKHQANADEIYTMFMAHQLPYNIVDAPVDDLSVLPADWLEVATKELGKETAEGALCWVMTNAPNLSHWHTDPEYNDPAFFSGNPGGWMKLIIGRKIWWALPKEHFSFLESKGHTVESVAKLTLSEMLQLENCYCWGKILVGEIGPGDMLWFPPGCLHKVVTLEHSKGWGGYI